MRNILIIIAVAIVTIVSILIVQNINDVEIAVDGGVLIGTLSKSGNEHDTVTIIVAGSGPTDRDGNTPIIHGRNDSLLQLSNSLNAYGVDTFRYDKRTSGESLKSFTADPSFDDFVDDLIACIHWLKEQDYNKIYVAGHSQGSLLSILAAQQENVTGLVSMAGTARPIDEVIIEQYTAQGLGEKITPIFEVLRTGMICENIPEDMALQFSPANQQFLLNWMQYDPLTELNKLDIPILFLQGDEDIQVPVTELELFRAVAPTADYKILRNTNHVLKIVESSKQNQEAYTDPSYQLSPELVEAMFNFIK